MRKKDKLTIDRWHRAEGKTASDERQGMEGNLNSMTHGIWANQCLNEEERALFNEVVDRLSSDFEFNMSSDHIQVELVAIYYLKLIRAQANDDVEAAEKLDRMLRSNLKDLKATKITREKVESKRQETTPAEWATAFIEEMRAKGVKETNAAANEPAKSDEKVMEKQACREKCDKNA